MSFMKLLSKVRFIFVIIFITLALFFYLLYCFNSLDYKIVRRNANFYIKQGESIEVIKGRLCKLLDLNRIQCYLFSKKINFELKYWNYYFESWDNVYSVINKLKKWPSVKYYRFTILPGWTKFDILSTLKSKIVADKFLYLVDSWVFVNKILKLNNLSKYFSNIQSLEGFLYPDTYFFRLEDLTSIYFPNLLIKVAVSNFSKKWSKLRGNCLKNSNCNPYNLSPYEILILASIVEKEERDPKNKPLVADILIRRYINWWSLWADWTLCYGLKLKSKECYYNINYKTLKDKNNVYNTRLRKGLPPTPVGNPTIQTIKAVIYPKKNNYWYYLHDKNWHIHFATTLNQHIYNKNKYLK